MNTGRFPALGHTVMRTLNQNSDRKHLKRKQILKQDTLFESYWTEWISLRLIMWLHYDNSAGISQHVLSLQNCSCTCGRYPMSTSMLLLSLAPYSHSMSTFRDLGHNRTYHTEVTVADNGTPSVFKGLTCHWGRRGESGGHEMRL